MELSDIIAFYAAILSSFLAFIEIRRQSKLLKIVIDYVYFYETAYIGLINQSARPITITSIAMKMGGEPVPSGCMFSPDEGQIKFPMVVQKYSSVQLHLTDTLSSHIYDNKARNFSIQVFDIEGKIFSKYEVRGVNGKWGGIDKDMFKR